MKVEKTRLGSPTTLMSGKRARISSQMIFSCSSASRLPTQRWIPEPKDDVVAGPFAVDDVAIGVRDHLFVAVAQETYHMMTLSPFLIDLPWNSISAVAVRRM